MSEYTIGNWDKVNAENAALKLRVEELEKAHAVLFDGYTVYQELTDAQKRITSNKNVADVLDAVIRVQKKEALNSTKEAV